MVEMEWPDWRPGWASSLTGLAEPPCYQGWPLGISTRGERTGFLCKCCPSASVVVDFFPEGYVGCILRRPSALATYRSDETFFWSTTRVFGDTIGAFAGLSIRAQASRGQKDVFPITHRVPYLPLQDKLAIPFVTLNHQSRNKTYVTPTFLVRLVILGNCVWCCCGWAGKRR